MIITRSPLRISIGGGGTDLPSYYLQHEGYLIAATIDKFVYIALHQTFEPGLTLKYSKMERVCHVDEVQHPIIREALRLLHFTTLSLELASMADIPAGTGLGSSGSFTTALLKALHTSRKDIVHPHEIAREACHIEMNLLGEPVGKQDPYISTYGGIASFRFLPNEDVQIRPLNIPTQVLYQLEDNLLLYFTRLSRSASTILSEQDEKSRSNNAMMLENLHFVKKLAIEIQSALEGGDLRQFAELMNVHWEHKKQRSQKMTNNQIDAWYQLARENGALGGKLIGAGGGGFLLFYSEDKARLRHAMGNAGLSEVRFRFDFEGTKTLVQ